MAAWKRHALAKPKTATLRVLGDPMLFLFTWPPCDTVAVQDPTNAEITNSAIILEGIHHSYIVGLLDAMAAVPRESIREYASRWLDWCDFGGTNVKFFSHFGAIQLRASNMESCHWIHPLTKQRCFDSTRGVYSSVDFDVDVACLVVPQRLVVHVQIDRPHSN